MNKKIKYVISTVSLLSMLVIGATIYAQQSGVSIMERWGKILNNNFKQEKSLDSTIYAKGKSGNILISDIEQAKEFYLLSGMDEITAKQEAINYAYEREALYQAAIKNGYSVTEEEIWDYLEQLKELMKTASNKDEVEAIIGQFPSEEDYWNFQFTVYQKNLPIQNYVKDMEKTFMSTSQYSNDKEETDLQANWIQQFNHLKEELVKEENFQEMQ